MGSPSPRTSGRLRALVGRVVALDDAGALVLTSAGRLRATWGGSLLAASACCPEALPRRGDAVRLTAWPDARTTVEAVIMRPVRTACPARPDAVTG
jgi:hypothetical protein